MITLKQVKTVVRGYKTIHKLAPGYLLFIFFGSVIGTMIPFIGFVMSAMIVNALTEGKDLRHMLILAAVTILLNFITHVIINAIKGVQSYHESKFYEVIDEPLNEKIRHMDYERVEDPKTHAMIEKVKMLKKY